MRIELVGDFYTNGKEMKTEFVPRPPINRNWVGLRFEQSTDEDQDRVWPTPTPISKNWVGLGFEQKWSWRLGKNITPITHPGRGQSKLFPAAHVPHMLMIWCTWTLMKLVKIYTLWRKQWKATSTRGKWSHWSHKHCYIYTYCWHWEDHQCFSIPSD